MHQLLAIRKPYVTKNKADTSVTKWLRCVFPFVPARCEWNDLRYAAQLGTLVYLDTRHARTAWTDVSNTRIDDLRALTKKYGVSVALGDVRLLDGRW